MRSTHGLAFLDGYPVSPGHALVIPKRHVATIFDLTSEEYLDLWTLVRDVRNAAADDYGVRDFNIGLNDGERAGQTVMHAHIHIIPRRSGDVADPRGGVRWVIPERAAYWGSD
jgi:diadenosine tetraphosphate (Ap4A) HIT family hydrolase